MDRESFCAVSATGDVIQLRAFYAAHKWNPYTTFTDAPDWNTDDPSHLDTSYAFIHQGSTKPTPLHEAASLGHLGTVKFFIEEVRCNLLQFSAYWRSNPLHIACRRGHLEVVKYLLNANPTLINCEERLRGVPPLVVATESGHLEIVKFICEFPGVDLNVNLHGRSVLYLACTNGDVEMVKYLGSIPAIKTEEDGTITSSPLCVACHAGNLEVVRFLVEELKFNPGGYHSRFSSTQPLAHACVSGNSELVRYLLKFPEVDINKNGSYSMNALTQTGPRGHLDILKVLLSDWRHLEYEYDSCHRVLSVHSSLHGKVYDYEIHDLLAAYKKHPDATRNRLRNELGLSDEIAADFFSLMIFFTDDFLSFRPLK